MPYPKALFAKVETEIARLRLALDEAHGSMV
jgi:hypothetical protein